MWLDGSVFSKMHSRSTYTINGTFLTTVILETQPLVIFTWQPDSAVHLTAVCRVELQFHLSQSNVDICKKIYYLLKTIQIKTLKYFLNFNKYTYLSQKSFLCPYLLIC